MTDKPITYWCSSPDITGEVVVINGIVYKTPKAWYRWRGASFEVFKRRCHIDKYEEVKT
jgi:hypothetical protein